MSSTTTITTCKHCGDPCEEDAIIDNQLTFCCHGCHTVYTILTENGMTNYYQFEDSPGVSKKSSRSTDYTYLEDDGVAKHLIKFEEGDLSKIELTLPSIHCSSCLWLLERLNKLDNGVIASTVNFSAKRVSITFNKQQTSLVSIVHLLDKIGYAPRLNFNHIEDHDRKGFQADKQLLYRLGLAGFCFGNIMLLSFPEYLGFEKASYLFQIGYINIILATPVLLYSGWSYISSAWKSLRQGRVNLDLPIAIGMLTLYSRSIFELLSKTGEGYMDSFSGFVFFLLIGRWFQSYTYHVLDFERNYKSYFPISSLVKKGAQWISKTIDKLMPNDTIMVRSQELIPVDGYLKTKRARINYSFVSGESDLITKLEGEKVFAGGKNEGGSIEVLVVKKVDQSYLTQLWNDTAFDKSRSSKENKLIEIISKYFTIVVFIIALSTFGYWYFTDSSKMWHATTAVLIVACPCALALAIPFTYGHLLRLLAGRQLFLKNVDTISKIHDINHFIFDKTGTLTDQQKIDISYIGRPLTDQEEIYVKSTALHSSHPLSKALTAYLEDSPKLAVDQFEEIVGSGIKGCFEDVVVRLGSESFIFGTEDHRETSVFIEIGGEYIGRFIFQYELRKELLSVVKKLQSYGSITVLSGDTDREQGRLQSIIGDDVPMYFNQKPQEKLAFVKNLQSKGEHVMMVGDGLNDAGALKQADVGLVVSDASNNFTPACDIILDGSKFDEMGRFIHVLRASRWIIYGTFLLAFLYNAIGMGFAVSGNMSPVIAAILMPLSSITVIVFGVVGGTILFKKLS